MSENDRFLGIDEFRKFIDRNQAAMSDDELNRRECEYFAKRRGWYPPAGVDIHQWIGDMREVDERLCNQEDEAMK